ncbi:hypothetical protein EBT31_06035 [bacterium]|nr:hypothetical protein [bacterium]
MAFSNTYSKTNGTNASAISNREDLTDVLTILAPEETPVLSLASKSKATATFNEWTVDSLGTPSTTGIQEGADISSYSDKFATRARLGNYVQLFRRDYMVSQLQQAVDSVGPAKLAEAEAKSIRELKRDVEKTICSDNDRSAEDGSSVRYQMRGLGLWLSNTPGADVPSAYRTPTASINGSGTTLTETVFNNLVASIFTQTGNVDALTLVAGTALRRVVSGYARNDGNTSENVYHVNQMADDKQITLAVNTYDSDFGLISVVNGNPVCLPDANRGYIINPNYIGVAELLSVGSTRVPNAGGGEKGFVDAALTLQVMSPLAHGKITHLT